MIEPKLKVKIIHEGPITHNNLLCWLCNEQPAVYDMHPNWFFRPCWSCQRGIAWNGKLVERTVWDRFVGMLKSARILN